MRSTRAFQALRKFSNLPVISRPRLAVPSLQIPKSFHSSPILAKTQTHILSDIGEGVKEVQIIQWFVQEGAAVEEWAPLCEVQSDKASVEITSKYTGVIKKLHFDQDAIVQVGDAMLDIEVDGAEDAEESEALEESGSEKKDDTSEAETRAEDDAETSTEQSTPGSKASETPEKTAKPPSKHGGLATPAVRGLLKEHSLDITEIEGTGKDGRVLKEDIFRHLEGDAGAAQKGQDSQSTRSKPAIDSKQTETAQKLTAVQSAMFKSMTKSLQIPHFLYSDKIDVTSLATMRRRLNDLRDTATAPKFTYLPFVIKAVSLALNQHPLLNARLDVSENPSKPQLQLRSNHNIGVAMDTPAGLLVPVIKSVNARSILSIAQELQRLSESGKANKLSNEDLSGGTITVSNIGNIGGDTVAPVIVEGQLAILGLGKIKATPVFGTDGKTVERADLMSASWSADHRVIDGATMARVARLVQGFLEQPETMMVEMS